MPNLSVIVPNYNHAIYLPEALDAILSQSWKPIEVLVVDDASTDQSCEIVKNYQKKYSNLSLLRFEKNSGGPIEPIKQALEIVKGDCVALIASDDIIQPSFFAEAMNMMLQNSEIGLCCGDFCFFKNQKPYALEPVSLFQTTNPTILLPDELVEISRKNRFYIPSQTTIYRKELVLQYGSYNPKLESIADFYLNCQIALRHKVAYIPKIFGAVRIRPDSYGRCIRFDLKKRKQVAHALIQQIESEDSTFQTMLKRSGILALAGVYMVAYFAYHPKYWDYFTPAFKKRFIYSK